MWYSRYKDNKKEIMPIKNILFFSLYLTLLINLPNPLLAANQNTENPSTTEDVQTNETRIHWWRIEEFEFGIDAILKNIVGATQILNGMPASADTRGNPGAVVAAPSTNVDTQTNEVHDYNWTWKRDAAIVMKSVLDLWEHGYFHNKNKELFEIMSNYVEFSRQDQVNLEKGTYGIGDAKVTLNNSPNPNEWGGPQTDGPALQNLTLIKLFNHLQTLVKGSVDLNSISQLREIILKTVITNTEYTIHNYNQLSVDTWEEVKAKSHFATLMVQREALAQAEALYHKLQSQNTNLDISNLKNLLYKIRTTQRLIKAKIKKDHLSKEYGYILAHHGVEKEMSLMRDKVGNLDTQVNLGLLQVHTPKTLSSNDSFLSPSNPWFRATVEQQRQNFMRMYAINSNGVTESGKRIKGYGVGRYEGDRHFGGQIWTLTTLAKIKGYLSDAIESSLKGKFVITNLDRQYFLNLETGLSDHLLTGTIKKHDYRFEIIMNALMRRSKSIFYRVMDHTGPDDFVLTEIIDKDSGFKRGIENLTWSYVEFINAYRLLLKAQKMGLSTKPSDRARSLMCRSFF